MPKGVLAGLGARPDFDEDFNEKVYERLPEVGPVFQAPTHPHAYPYKAEPFDMLPKPTVPAPAPMMTYWGTYPMAAQPTAVIEGGMQPGHLVNPPQPVAIGAKPIKGMQPMLQQPMMMQAGYPMQG